MMRQHVRERRCGLCPYCGEKREMQTVQRPCMADAGSGRMNRTGDSEEQSAAVYEEAGFPSEEDDCCDGIQWWMDYEDEETGLIYYDAEETGIDGVSVSGTAAPCLLLTVARVHGGCFADRKFLLFSGYEPAERWLYMNGFNMGENPWRQDQAGGYDPCEYVHNRNTPEDMMTASLKEIQPDSAKPFLEMRNGMEWQMS